MRRASGVFFITGRNLLALCAWAIVLPQLTCSLMAPASVGAATGHSVQLRTEARVRGAEILLADVAEVACVDPDLRQRLEQLVVGKAPLAGQSRRISADYVRLRLRQLDVGAVPLLLTGAEQVEVTRPGAEIGEEQIRQIVTEYIRASGIWGAAEVRIAELNISGDRTLPEGRASYRVLPPRHMRSLVTVPLSVVFDVEGRFQKTIRATVRIEALAPVVVAARPIGRLKPIESDDLKMEKMNLAELPAGVLTDEEEIIGMRARRNIDAGDTLRPDLLEMPPLVKRGDMVTIVAAFEGIKVTATGEVKSDGLRGERVNVVNLDSKKRFSARVVDKKTVMVDF